MTSSFIEKFKLYSDLDGDGDVDVSDFKLGLKYIAIIYGGLLTVLYTLFGESIELLKENIYFIIVLLIIAVIISVVLVIWAKNNNKYAKLITALKQTNLDQAGVIDDLKKEIEEKIHEYNMDTILKDFMLRVKDGISRELMEQINAIYEAFTKEKQKE